MKCVLMMFGLLACGPAAPSPSAPSPPPPSAPRTEEPAARVEAPPAPTDKALAAGEPGKARPPTVIVSVEARKKGKAEIQLLSPDGTLESGDEFALHFQVDRAAHAYVVLASADGTQSILFPKHDDTPIQPGTDQRVPAVATRWLRLDEKVGMENLLVFAAPAPIPEAVLKDRIAAMVATAPVATIVPAKTDTGVKVSTAPTTPPAAARPPVKHQPVKVRVAKPQGASEVDRGASEVEGTGIVGEPDKDGVTSARFSFTHR